MRLRSAHEFRARVDSALAHAGISRVGSENSNEFMLTVSIPAHISQSFETVIFLEPVDNELETVKRQLTLAFDATGKSKPYNPSLDNKTQ